jgi:hypothetical protein
VKSTGSSAFSRFSENAKNEPRWTHGHTAALLARRMRPNISIGAMHGRHAASVSALVCVTDPQLVKAFALDRARRAASNAVTAPTTAVGATTPTVQGEDSTTAQIGAHSRSSIAAATTLLLSASVDGTVHVRPARRPKTVALAFRDSSRRKTGKPVASDRSSGGGSDTDSGSRSRGSSSSGESSASDGHSSEDDMDRAARIARRGLPPTREPMLLHAWSTLQS